MNAQQVKVLDQIRRQRAAPPRMEEPQVGQTPPDVARSAVNGHTSFTTVTGTLSVNNGGTGVTFSGDSGGVGTVTTGASMVRNFTPPPNQKRPAPPKAQVVPKKKPEAVLVHVPYVPLGKTRITDSGLTPVRTGLDHLDEPGRLPHL